MVESFIEGKMPEENWNDGLLVCQLMMMAYMSAETGRKIKFDTNKVKGYIPKVALGEWNPKTQTQ